MRLLPTFLSVPTEKFQSTHPMRGATFFDVIRIFFFENFNPRTPCEVRLSTRFTFTKPKIFQSTHPMRGATINRVSCVCIPLISIHAPHARCDNGIEKGRNPQFPFQSTHPMRGATHFVRLICLFRQFQSTHPMRGATGKDASKTTPNLHFNPRTPCEVRLFKNSH